jgi:hypothetical protein
MIEKGEYTNFEIDATGNLVITLTDDGKNFLLSDDVNNPDLNDYDILRDLIEDQLCNGWTWLNPEDVAALTDSPILSNDAEFDDYGNLIGAVHTWWFPDYQTIDLAEEIFKEGQLIFTKGEY